MPLGVGIVQYEWYGGDTQKRSLGNRFASWGLITNVISFTTAGTFVGFLRLVNNPELLPFHKTLIFAYFFLLGRKGIFTHTFCRYNIGSASMKVSLFKIYFGFLLAGFWFANLVALLRFMQVCVWKRVVEINEDLGFRIASLSVFSGTV